MRKFWVVALVMLLSFGLMACAKEEPPKADSQKEEKSDSGSTQEDEANKGLTKVGETKQVEGATYKLLKIANPEKTLKLGSVDFTLHTVKIVEATKMSKEFKEFIQMDGKPVGDKAYLIQTDYTVKNNKDVNITFIPVEYMVLSNGEQIDVVVADLSGQIQTQFFGKVDEDGRSINLLKKPVDQVDSVKVVTGMVIEEESGDTFADKKQFEVKFE